TFSNYDFSPWLWDDSFNRGDDGVYIIPPKTVVTFAMGLNLPPGTETVAIRVTGRLFDASNVCELHLRKINEAGTSVTTLQTAAINDVSNVQTIQQFISETVDPDYRYSLVVTMEDNSGS